MTDWYVPPHFRQFDGSMCEASNCWATVGKWLADGATSGAVNVTPSEFRKHARGGSGSKGKDGCRSGFESDIVEGLDNLGIKAGILRLTRSQARDALDTTRRALYGVAIDYEVLGPQERCQGTFEGNHMLGIIGGTPATVSDPLCPGYKPLGLNTILDAAEKFAEDHGRPEIWLVRVRRQLPPSMPSDRAEVAKLQARIEDLEAALGDINNYGVATVRTAKQALDES